MAETKLQNFFEQAKTFVGAANQYLPKNNQLFFSGDIFTGKAGNPEILFLSINPGFLQSDWDEYQKSLSKSNVTEFMLKPCKYIMEYKRNAKLATKIADVILNNDITKYDNCGETYIKSFFATPDEATLNKQLSLLPSNLQQQHQEMMQEYQKFILETIQPKHIICIGMTVFNQVKNVLKITNQDITDNTYATTAGNNRVFYKVAKYNDIHIHGMLHLSGAHIATVAIDNITNIFKELI